MSSHRGKPGAGVLGLGAVLRVRNHKEHGPGDPLGIFQAVTYQPDGDAWLPTGGDTVTYAIEFSNPPRAIGVCVYGNASREGSPHTSDQIALYATARGRPVLRDPDDIREAAREHEHLVLPTAETG